MISQLFDCDYSLIPRICFKVDLGLGLIPAFTTIYEHNNQRDSNDFDFITLLTQLRQKMIKLGLSSHDNNDLTFALSIKKAEQLLVNRLQYNYLTKIKARIQKTFNDLILNDLISDYKLPENKNDVYKVTIDKSQDKINRNRYLICRDFNEKICLPNNFPHGPYKIKNNPIKNSDATIEKFILTPKLKQEFDAINIFKFVADKNTGLNLEKLKNYTPTFFLPLVATIHNFPDQTSTYFMIHYKVKDKVSLDIVNKDLDHLLPEVLKEHHGIRTLLKKIRSCCRMPSTDCFIKKLLVREPNSSEICVIFFVTFLSEVVYTRQKNLPLKKLYTYLATNFRDWEIFMNGVMKFSLLEDSK